MSNTEILTHYDASALIRLRILISLLVGVGFVFAFVGALTIAVFVGFWWMSRQVIVLVMTSQKTQMAYATLGVSI